LPEAAAVVVDLVELLIVVGQDQHEDLVDLAGVHLMLEPLDREMHIQVIQLLLALVQDTLVVTELLRHNMQVAAVEVPAVLVIQEILVQEITLGVVSDCV